MSGVSQEKVEAFQENLTKNMKYLSFFSNPFEQRLEMWNMNLVYCDGFTYSGTQGYLDGTWYFQESDDEDDD
jgi:hypothetical protein